MCPEKARTHRNPFPTTTPAQSFLGFEQVTQDADLAAATVRLNAKLAEQAQRAIRKRQAEMEKKHPPLETRGSLPQAERHPDRAVRQQLVYAAVTPGFSGPIAAHVASCSTPPTTRTPNRRFAKVANNDPSHNFSRPCCFGNSRRPQTPALVLRAPDRAKGQKPLETLLRYRR